MIPRRGTVLVEPLNPSEQLQPAWGIIIPDVIQRGHKRRYEIGVVAYIGSEVYDLKPGDRIIFPDVVHWNGKKPYHPNLFQQDGKNYISIKAKDIYSVIED